AMADDYENLHGVDDMDDRDLRDLIREQLEAHNGIDADYITVRVQDGAVVLDGRVGTDSERRVAEHIVTDSLGLTEVQNNLVVQGMHRAETPADMEDHLVDEERAEGLLLGDREIPLSPEAEHLEEDLDARLWGTSDIGKAIAEG